MINTDKEIILAKIEQLKHYGPIPYDKDMFEGVCLIESFINSLPVEHQSEDLEEEIKRKYESNIGLMMPIEDFRKLILHFVNWQKNQTINKACEWLQKHINDYLVHGRDIDFLYDDFCKAMEDEQ